MTRSLYRSLVWLHPPAFRAEFGGEMLWVFDEISAAASGGVPALFADAVVSLLRQWVIGRGTWKIAAGFAGGVLHMWLVFTCLMLRPPLPKVPPTPDAPCGSMMHRCVALDRRPEPAQDRLCSNCETSPSSIPEFQP